MNYRISINSIVYFQGAGVLLGGVMGSFLQALIAKMAIKPKAKLSKDVFISVLEFNNEIRLRYKILTNFIPITYVHLILYFILFKASSLLVVTFKCLLEAHSDKLDTNTLFLKYKLYLRLHSKALF